MDGCGGSNVWYIKPFESLVIRLMDSTTQQQHSWKWSFIVPSWCYHTHISRILGTIRTFYCSLHTLHPRDFCHSSIIAEYAVTVLHLSDLEVSVWKWQIQQSAKYFDIRGFYNKDITSFHRNNKRKPPKDREKPFIIMISSVSNNMILQSSFLISQKYLF